MAASWRCRGGVVAVSWRGRGGVIDVSWKDLSQHAPPCGVAWLPGNGAPPSSPARHGPPDPQLERPFPDTLPGRTTRAWRLRQSYNRGVWPLAQAHHAASRSYDRFVAPHWLATLTTTAALPESEEKGSAVPSILVLVRACRLAGAGMLRET